MFLSCFSLLLWSPTPHVPFLYQAVWGMEVLCQVWNESPPKPPNPCKGLHFFHIFRGWIGFHLINHSFWDNPCLFSTKQFPKTLQQFLGLWFSVDSLPILSLINVPIESAKCPAAEVSLHVSTLYHQCNGPFSWCEEEEQGQIFGYHPMIYFTAILVTTGKYSKGPFLPLCVEANWSCGSAPRDMMTKVLAKSGTASYTCKTVVKVSKMVTMLDTAAWIRGTTLFHSR